MKAIVAVAGDGQLVIPRPLREQLGIADGGEVQLDVEDGTMFVRAVDRLTPDEQEHIHRSRADYAAGRYRTDVSPEELLQRFHDR